MSIDVVTVRARAVAAVTARKPEPETGRRVSAADGALFITWDVHALNAIRPAATIAEFLDDSIAYCPFKGSAVAEVIYSVAEAARLGPAEAVAAVRAARGLDDPWDQWAAFSWLGEMESKASRVPGGQDIMRPVMAEWTRLGLAERRPDSPRASLPPAGAPAPPRPDRLPPTARRRTASLPKAG